MIKRLTAITLQEVSGYVALCPDLDVASQSSGVVKAFASLQEALNQFLEVASSKKIGRRSSRRVFATDLEVAAS